MNNFIQSRRNVNIDEYIFYKTSTCYIQAGAMGRLSHDKGERAGLGRLVEVCVIQ